MNEIGHSGAGMSQGVCPECGFSHPPTPGGCPMKKQTSPSGENVDFNSFVTTIKNVLFSQIKMKDIKNSKKFLDNIIIECTKAAESYKE